MTVYRCALFSRRADVAPAQFASHWLGVHGPLAARLPGLGTYRQNHIRERLDEATDSPVQAIDGIAQLSFPSIAAAAVKLMWVSTRRADLPSAGLRGRWVATNRDAARERLWVCT